MGVRRLFHQFAAIAARFDNVVPGLNNPFTDVAEDYWARDLIAFVMGLLGRTVPS